jgi:hypothetical protein
MAVRTEFWIAMAAAAALSACGGGGGSDSGDTPPVSGLPNPDDIVDADPAYIASLEQYLALLEEPIFDGDRGVPTGSATYTGVGRIYDASVDSNDVTAASLLDRSVVTDVRATIDFAGTGITVTQDGFRDVRNNPVSGSAEWVGSFNAADRVFDATVTGEVGGTQFETEPDRAAILFYGDNTKSGVVGRFQDADVTSSGTFEGTAITGDFAAESD